MWRIGGKCCSQETSEVLQYFSPFQDTELTSYLDLSAVLLNRAHSLPREGHPDLESDAGSDGCMVLVF